MRLLSTPVALVLAGVWLILFSQGDATEVLDIAFGAAIAACGALPLVNGR